MKNLWYDYETEEQELNRIELEDMLTDNIETVKNELNRKLALAQKYGYEEYADELAILLEKLDTRRRR